MSLPKFIYFDIGGVLCTENGPRVMAERIGIDYETFRAAEIKYRHKCLTGKITANKILDLTLRDLGKKNTVGDYNKFWTKYSQPIEAGHDLVISLSKNFQIGLLTNINSGAFKWYKHYKLFPDVNYAAIVQSSELGYKKPEKQIYYIAQRLAKIKKPPDILFIDDREINLEEPQKLGWQVYLFDKDNPEKSANEVLTLLL